MPAKPGFGRRLVKIMEERDIPIAYLAVQLPAHPVSISKWRGGQLPAPARLARLAGLLGVSVPWLRDGTGPRELPEDVEVLLEAQREFRAAYGASALELAPYVESGQSIPAAIAYTLLRRLFEAGTKAIVRPRLPEVASTTTFNNRDHRSRKSRPAS